MQLVRARPTALGGAFFTAGKLCKFEEGMGLSRFGGQSVLADSQLLHAWLVRWSCGLA